MTKIRHYDPASNSWIIDGASNASNIELSNPGFLDENGKSVNVDNGFTKLDNRLSKLEQNVAWIYLNGAKGGGGGPGGGGGVADYYIDLSYQSSIVYTTTGTVVLDLLINSAGLSKNFKVNVIGDDNTKYIQDKSQRSMTRFQLEVTGITQNTTLEISAYDSTGIAATPAYIDVVVGALYLNIIGNPSKTIMIGGTNPASITFNVTNKTGNNAKFLLYETNSADPYGNQETPVLEQTIRLSEQNLTFQLRTLCEQLSENGVLTPGRTFRFKAVATQDNLGLITPYKTHNVTVVNSDTLLIVTDGITASSDNPSSFVQGGFVQFSYFFSYNSTKYSDFAYKYNVYYVEGASEVLVDQGQQSSGITPNVTYSFGYNTSKLNETKDGNYYKIVMTGYATADPTMSDSTAVYTHTVYFVLSQADQSIMQARNYNNNLLAYFGAFHFPTQKTGTWLYEMPSEGNYFEYLGTYMNQFKNGIALETYKVDGVNSGFITDSNSVRYIGLANGSYATIPAFTQLLPKINTNLIDETLFRTGFCISTTFKAEDSVDDTETILSLGKYEDDDLSSGFEITLNQARIKIKGTSESTVDLPKGQLLTVDLNVNPATIVTESGQQDLYYFIIYVNGVMSACSRVFKSDVDWMFGTPLYLGCRNDLSHPSICKIFDCKLYTAAQSDVTIVQNYISATEQALLINGAVDESLDIDLRTSNFFIGEAEDGNGKGPCVLWDYSNEQYYAGRSLYNTLKNYVTTGDISYPIVFIQETSLSSSFETDCGAVWGEGDSEILNRQHPVTITLTNAKGECKIESPEGVSEANSGPRVAIQGTSSLSYTGKNLEIYAGTTDGVTPMLVNVDDGWLPENEFTLKADVVDSGHVNNTAIGRIINTTTVLDKTPPMTDENLWTANGVDRARAQEIMSKIKHTSDGFPCLVFVQFASGNIKFQGIYNFNLGRYAYYNLGLKILLDYDKPDGVVEGAPYLVTSYKELTNGYDGKTYSIEIGKHNDNQFEAFQQADENTVRWMSDCRYTSTNENDAYTAVTDNLYRQLAEMSRNQIQKMHRTGITATDTYVPIENEYWGTQYQQWYTYSECDTRLSIRNAMSYYVLAMVFGLVDSMCKNLTLRSWGGTRWWTCFYDMDTAFKMDNSGSQAVKYWAHFHKFFNVTSGGLTTSGDDTNVYQNTGIERWSAEKSDDFYQYFASTWSRLWEAMEMLPMMNPSGEGNDLSIGQIYWNLRTSIFSDPKKFIENYYKSYVKQCGPILYNYDYSIKYIAVSKKYVNGQLIDTTESNQASFLHGTRVDAVADWFEKRIYFLDSVYSGQKPSSTVNPSIANIESPLNNTWNANKAGSKAESDETTSTAVIGLAAKSQIKYAYNVGNNGIIYSWIKENPTELSVMVPVGEKTVLFQGNRYITEFENFKRYNWTQLRTIEFPELIELDLSNLTLKDPLFNDWSQSANPSSNLGLKNIKKLNLSNLKITGATSLSLDVSNCTKLEELNLSGSSYTNFTLPASGSLRHLNLSNTALLKLGDLDSENPFENQSSLEVLDITGCSQLESIYIRNCESLKTINIPTNVKKVWIVNCASFEDLHCTYSGDASNVSPLVEIHIENCSGLKRFNVSGQNNPDLNVYLLGCDNLEELNVSNTTLTGETLILPAKGFKTLKTLDISRTTLGYLRFGLNDIQDDYLNLIDFEDLSSLSAQECSNLSKVVCANNKENPIELKNNSFEGCSSLRELYGNFIIEGEKVFSGCSSLVLDLDTTSDFVEGSNVTNIQFKKGLLSCYNLFQGCSSINIDTFRYVMNKIPETVTSLEGMFQGCSNISGKINRSLLNRCKNVTSLKDAFSGTSLYGALESRKSSYNVDDQSTWGFFDFVPNINTIENAFSNTQLDAIDELVFEPVKDVLTNIDYCFSNCVNLHSVKDTNAVRYEDYAFQTKTFFTQLTRLSNTLGFPVEVFSGCQYIKMQVTEEDGNTYLFHTNKNSEQAIVLIDTLYAGVQLIGYIGENTFGGITRNLGNYYIPKFSSINTPFGRCVGNQLLIKLDEVENLFQNQDRISQLLSVFVGVTCEKGHDIIPSGLFKNCSSLLNISKLFSGFELTNNGQVYEFPTNGLFDDCVNLNNISNLFQGQRNLKIKLVGEGFKNCALQNVSGTFAQSGLFGVIPYRLWYMERDGNIQRTINNMDGTFADCVCLGYSEDRQINTKLPTFEDSEGNISYLDWTYGIPVAGKEGTRMFYNMEQSDDIWQMDGRPWSKPDSMSEEDWEILYNKYFIHDENQQKAIQARDSQVIKYTREGYQNYIIPCDYFRYCSNDCSLNNSLKGINRRKPVLVFDEATQLYQIDRNTTSEEIMGLVGRIPCKLFEELSNNSKIDGVFKDVYVSAYINSNITFANNNLTITRGIKFPYDLFENNLELTSVVDIFSGMQFEVGVDINPELFINNTKLQDISGVFSYCYFDSRDYLSDNIGITSGKHSQIPFEQLFSKNEIITNASNLFLCNSVQTNLIQGPIHMDKTLLDQQYQMQNISQCFANCSSMRGTVPVFLQTSHPFLVSYSGYLENCSKDLITNWQEVQWLVPPTWLS